jgi:hypothetical protein
LKTKKQSANNQWERKERKEKNWAEITGKEEKKNKRRNLEKKKQHPLPFIMLPFIMQWPLFRFFSQQLGISSLFLSLSLSLSF